MGGFSRLDRDDGQQSEMRIFKEKRRTQQNEMAQRVQIAFSNEAASPIADMLPASTKPGPMTSMAKGHLAQRWKR